MYGFDVGYIIRGCDLGFLINRDTPVRAIVYRSNNIERVLDSDLFMEDFYCDYGDIPPRVMNREIITMYPDIHDGRPVLVMVFINDTEEVSE